MLAEPLDGCCRSCDTLSMSNPLRILKQRLADPTPARPEFKIVHGVHHAPGTWQAQAERR